MKITKHTNNKRWKKHSKELYRNSFGRKTTSQYLPHQVTIFQTIRFGIEFNCIEQTTREPALLLNKTSKHSKHQIRAQGGSTFRARSEVHYNLGVWIKEKLCKCIFEKKGTTLFFTANLANFSTNQSKRLTITRNEPKRAFVCWEYSNLRIFQHFHQLLNHGLTIYSWNGNRLITNTKWITKFWKV